MTEPVARIQSIVFGEGYAHAYAFADGKFYPLPVGGEVSGGQNIPVPAVVYRAHGARGFSRSARSISRCMFTTSSVPLPDAF
jgi:hypothetical protein